MIKQYLFGILLIFLVSCSNDYFKEEIQGEMFSPGDLEIVAWNLQIFGLSKASNSTLMDSYVEVLKKYDIIFLQEIRDESGEAFNQLCQRLPEYNCLISNRAGTTSSKEQYGLLSNKTLPQPKITDYTTGFQNIFERPPYSAEFTINNYTFTATVIHVKPEFAEQEIADLEILMADKIGNQIILGDLNADCSYFLRDDEFTEWDWLINDNVDTTTSNTDCAYDRIIINKDAHNEISSSFIDMSVTRSMSDHYLIGIDLKLGEIR